MRFAATRSSMRCAMASSEDCCGVAVAAGGADWPWALAVSGARQKAEQDATRTARRNAIIFSSEERALPATGGGRRAGAYGGRRQSYSEYRDRRITRDCMPSEKVGCTNS